MAMSITRSTSQVCPGRLLAAVCLLVPCPRKLTQVSIGICTDSTSMRCKVTPDSPYRVADPCHSVECHDLALFGKDPIGNPKPAMNGFVENFLADDPARPPCDIMRVYTSKTVPVISTLATEFALFDNWHASVPGPTFPNRLYVHSGTSHGHGTNNLLQTAIGYPQPSIYELLDKKGKTWKAYFELISDTLFFQYTRDFLDKQHFIDDFYEHAAQGTLPDYSFLSPSWSDFADMPASDQHPDHDIAEGERLIKRVYEALRRSPQWEKSLLLITYDEGGGFYSKYPPVSKNVPHPDGRDSDDTDPVFRFDRLGVRVPTLVVSPWVRKGRVVHQPEVGQYEHSSVVSTLRKLFDLGPPLTRRDAWAAPFDHIWKELSSPRTDCPKRLPDPPGLHPHNQFLRGTQPMTDLSRDFVALAAGLNDNPSQWEQTVAEADLESEADAAMYIRKQVEKFLGHPVF